MDNRVDCKTCPINSSRDDDDEINLIDLFRTLYRYKWLIFLVILASAFCASIYLYSIEDIYEATATIMPVKGKKEMSIPFFKEDSDIDQIKTLLSANLPALYEDTTTSTIKAVLQSRAFNLHIVQKYNLLPKLYAERWNAEENKWRIAGRRQINPERTFWQRIFGYDKDSGEYQPTPIDGAMLMIEKLNVESTGNLMQIGFEDKAPAFCASMLQRYLMELDQYLRSREIERITENKRYLEKLLQTHGNSEMAKGIRQLLLNQIEAIMYAKGTSDFIYNVVDPPLIPQYPIKPKRSVILVLSVFVALFFGVFLAFFIEFLRNVRNAG